VHEDQEEEREGEEAKEWIESRALIRDEVSSSSREKVISRG